MAVQHPTTAIHSMIWTRAGDQPSTRPSALAPSSMRPGGGVGGRWRISQASGTMVASENTAYQK